MEAEVEARVEEETKVATGAGAGSMPGICLGLLLLEMALIVLVGLVAFVHLGDFLRYLHYTHSYSNTLYTEVL